MPGWARYLAPGQSDTVGVQFKTQGKRGKQTKSVTVTTNDPQNKNIIFKLSGEIFEPIQISPPAISIRTKLGESSARSVSIKNNLNRDLALGEIEYQDDEAKKEFAASLDSQILAPGQSTTFSVVFNATENSSRMYKTFKISTDYEDMSSLSIRVNAFVDQ